MEEVEKQVLEILDSNKKFISTNTSLRNNMMVIYKLSQAHIANMFSYMLLNRIYRTRIQFDTTKFLDDSVKSINFFFLGWNNILDNDDYFNFNRKPLDFYKQIPNHTSIKNFYLVGLAIDQILRLFQVEKKRKQLINFKKKNLLLALALLDIKKIYIEIDPSYPQSTLYQQFIAMVKSEVLEYLDLELTQNSIVDVSKRQEKPIKDLIQFSEHLEHFLRNFGEDDYTIALQKKINGLKKYLLKLNKFRRDEA